MSTRFAGHMHPRHAVRWDAHAPQHRRSNGRIRSALLAAAIGLVLAATAFYGLSGGFRP